jgi:hypothetical protein
MISRDQYDMMVTRRHRLRVGGLKRAVLVEPYSVPAPPFTRCQPRTIGKLRSRQMDAADASPVVSIFDEHFCGLSQLGVFIDLAELVSRTAFACEGSKRTDDRAKPDRPAAAPKISSL